MQEELDNLCGLKDATEDSKSYARQIEQHAATWKDLLTKMMDYTNEFIGEFPRRVKEAFRDMTLENTHETVFRFVLLCKGWAWELVNNLKIYRGKGPTKDLDLVILACIINSL